MGKSSTRKDKQNKPSQRDAKGQFLPGTSGNPGGLPREARELRKAFLTRMDAALALVDKWLNSSDFRQQRAGVGVVLERGLGEVAKASDLPDVREQKPVATEATSTAALLADVRGMLAQSVAGLRGRLEAGELGVEDIGSLGKLGHTLGELLKVEKEAAKSSDVSGLTDEELLQLVFSHLPVEKLRKALQQREAKEKAQPAVGGAS